MPTPESSTNGGFGQYQLVEKIAQGGMAEIFRGKALDTHGLEKQVVIKRILPQIAASPEFVEMLVDEAKIAVRLSHGNIAQVYDLGKVADDYFIVMEYVDGKTLSQIMRRLKTLNKKIPVPYALWLSAEVANGLDYMHRRADEQGNPLSIVHRDISPQNIILSTSGTVKIIDFGIAKAKTKISTTVSGILKGKFAYMSPEHADGEKLDSRTDIFSLGVILFELLTGQRLFKGKNNDETIRKVKKAKVPPPSRFRENLPKEINGIVFKSLQRDRDKRFQTAEEFSRELTRTLVTRYPDFSSHHLTAYLAEIFPDIQDKIPRDLPALAATQLESEKPEPTVRAPKRFILRQLEREARFDLPESEEAEPQEERTSRLHIIAKKVLKTVTPLAAVVLVGLFLYTIGPSLIEKVKRPPEHPITIRPETVRQSPVPSRPPLQASLSLTSEPVGAKVFLDDRETEWVTPATIRISPTKEHKIGLYLKNHLFWEGKFQLEPGKTVSLNVPLEINYGRLQILSAPEADLTLNGQKAGQTPYQITQVAPDTTFTILLRREGYEDWRREVKIFAGREEVVTTTLKKLTKPLR